MVTEQLRFLSESKFFVEKPELSANLHTFGGDLS